MIYTLFPIIAAICYGIAFAIDEKILEKINVTTLFFISTVAGLPIGLLMCWVSSRFKHEKISFEFIQDAKLTLMIISVIVLIRGGILLSLFAIQKTSATYAAFAEISYPLFVVLFAFLLFGNKTLNPSIILGGALVMLGSFILIYGQTKASTP